MRVHSLTLAGTDLYVSAESALWIVDVAKPAAPVTISLTTSIQALAVAVNGKYAYVSEVPTTKISVLDVSEPAHLTAIGSAMLPTPPSTLPPGISVGGYPVQYDGIQVLHVSGSLLFALIYQPNAGMPEGNGLYILDISSPAMPRQICYFPNSGVPGTLVIPGSGGTASYPAIYQDLAIAGKYAYMASGGPDGMQVLDISDPKHPNEVAHVLGYGGGQIIVIDNNAYLHYGGGAYIVDINDPIHPHPVSSLFPENAPSTFSVVGKYIYFMIRGDKTNPIYIHA